MRRSVVATVLLFLAPMLAYAEIYKLAVTEEPGIRFYWWPVVKSPAGWAHDEGASLKSGVNMLVPIGQTFAGAPSVMYARADYKPRISDVHSIQEYVEKDRQELASESPETSITVLEPVKTSDGKVLTVLQYVIPIRKQWEIVAYGEEGEFYLLFTLRETLIYLHGLRQEPTPSEFDDAAADTDRV